MKEDIDVTDILGQFAEENNKEVTDDRTLHESPKQGELVDVMGDRELRTHLSHCNQGEYESSCKYGEDTVCPALAGNREILELRDRLKSHNNRCRDLLIDLRTFKFHASDEDMFLEPEDRLFYNKDLYFKHDPQNRNAPEVIHAQKQFCKFIGVPYSFFKNNRPSLKMNIVRTWQAGLSADETKVQCIVRVRESDDYATVRAMVPVKANPILNHELIEMVAQDTSLEMEFASGDERDDLTLHARFLLPECFDIGSGKYSVGFSLLASELGATPLALEVLLYERVSKTSYVASYGAEPYFRSKYEGIQPGDIKDLLPKMLERVKEETQDMLSAIRKRLDETSAVYMPADECAKINRMKGLNAKFKRALYHEVVECGNDITTPLDFARHMCLVAKDFDPMKRLDIERAAGLYLNLTFGKS